ncbi:PadR family transcriptional regulator [Streptomyces sp. NPDC096068]|uniref:PadR family transcriptional regulator n=1 Tax=Streptomyces sp. NPDC096068 TaxID=3155424 RepID=UPI003331C5EB
MNIRMTANVARVLRVFVDESEAQHHGGELLKRLRISSGTLYPVLARLTGAGLLTVETEEASPSELGRPARRLYTIDPDQLGAARIALAEFSSQITPTSTEPGRVWGRSPGTAMGGA